MRSTFWSKIEINSSATSEKVSERIKEMVAFFLDRTHGEPFSFKLYNYHPILLYLVDHSEQWEEVTITLPPSKLGYLCGAMGHLPHLKKLDISADIPDRRNRDGSPIPSNIFEDAPLLTHVVLWEPVMQYKFNWSSLTIVHFAKVKTLKNIHSILREAINLVELIIEWFQWDSDSEGGGLIYLPHLKRLDICDALLLAIFEAPSLQRLKICFDPRQSISLFNAGISVAFLRRSGIKLRTLVMTHCLAAIAKEILPFTPKVETLVLFNIKDVADLFMWLAGTGMRGLRQCRNLNILRVQIPHAVYGKALGALYDMIARRIPPGDVRDPSLREVTVIGTAPGWHFVFQSVVANLKLLCRDRGIHFRVAHRRGSF